MVIYKLLDNKNLLQALKDGAIGLLPTDTIYGITCSAFAPSSVERIYDIKGRDENKPVIVLMASIADLEKFEVKLDPQKLGQLKRNWPGKISIILPVDGDKYSYLTRGKASLAFRIPDDGKLVALLQKSGPLVSTSANKSGEKAATTVDEAITCFLNELDFYIDAGVLISEPSTLVDLSGKVPKIIRQGACKFREDDVDR